MESNLIFIDDELLVEDLALWMFSTYSDAPTFFYKKEGSMHVYEIEPLPHRCKLTSFNGEGDKFIIIGHVLHTDKYVCISTLDEKLKAAFDRGYNVVKSTIHSD